MFAYGTLGPDPSLENDPKGWRTDAVRGRLYDLGPYPVLLDWDDPAAGWVEGHVRPVDLRELEDILDPYEGTATGLFQRLAVTTRRGLEAWVYVFPHPLPGAASGPFRRWEGPRVDPQSGGSPASE